MARCPNREEMVNEFTNTFYGSRPLNTHIDYLEQLLDSDIIRAKIVPVNATTVLSPEEEKMLSFIQHYRHLQDNRYLAYPAGVMLINRFRGLLNRGLVVAPEVGYAGFVAVEIGDMQIEKAYLSFKDKKLREVWHFPYRRPKDSFIVWSRGKRYNSTWTQFFSLRSCRPWAGVIS
jgi:hypothetical protein